MKLVIIAGGRGIRLGFSSIPKSMVLVDGKPTLQYQIELAKRYGITDIYILIGFLAQVVIDYFGNGERFGVKINYIIEQKPLGTAGSVRQLEGIIKEKFIVFYGDTILDINLKKMILVDLNFSNHIATLFVHPNDHPYDSDLIEVDDVGQIIAFHSKPHPKNKYFNNLVNAALYIFSSEIFKYIKENENSDFGKDIFPLLIQKNKKIKIYKSAEYIKDIGTPERLKEVSIDVKSGKIFKLNKEFKRKAIFLDRDGVINEEGKVVSTPEEFKLLRDIPKSIRKINKSEYLAIIITNQPGIAKGFHSFNSLNNIHRKMEHLLGKDGAYVDGIYFCPHHPEKGFVGEINELKINCDCRKPNVGMIKKAVTDFNIDLRNSYFLGDTTRDIQTAKNSGIKSVLLKTGYAGLDNKFDIKPDYEFDSLDKAINFILEKSYDNK
jgi:histidinol-phosphate phosphatase family protein